MKQFAELLALRFNNPRTCYSYYRQMRLVHERANAIPPSFPKSFFAVTFSTSKSKKVGSPRPSAKPPLLPACSSSK
jgi:hypothetical protein